MCTCIHCSYSIIYIIAVFRVSNSSPGSTPIDVTVVGSSMLPYCHFDLPESDYLANRRPSNTKSVMLLNSGAAGSIDPATKVIEFTSTGTGHRISRYTCRYM